MYVYRVTLGLGYVYNKLCVFKYSEIFIGSAIKNNIPVFCDILHFLFKIVYEKDTVVGSPFLDELCVLLYVLSILAADQDRWAGSMLGPGPSGARR